MKESLAAFEIGRQAEGSITATMERRSVADTVSPHRELWDRNEMAQGVPGRGTRAAIFAHEVANSLTAVACGLQFVKAEIESLHMDDPVLTKVVQGALAEINNVGTMLHEYCSATDAQPLNLEIADFATLVEDVLVLHGVVCRAAGVRLQFECEKALPSVRVDALKIKQVITNLCKNANEAMVHGGRLTLKLYRAGGFIILAITDNGVGVPKSLDVFELLKSTKTSGRGLGLPLARTIIAAHNGTIAFTRAAGRSTTFKVALPIAENLPKQL